MYCADAPVWCGFDHFGDPNILLELVRIESNNEATKPAEFNEVADFEVLDLHMQLSRNESHVRFTAPSTADLAVRDASEL